MMWDEEVSEGTTNHQGTPGGPGMPRWVVPTWCTSLWYYLHQKFIKFQNPIRFLEHSENFYFWVIFLLHMKFRKQTKHVILFYLANKNRKQKVGTEGSAH